MLRIGWSGIKLNIDRSGWMPFYRQMEERATLPPWRAGAFPALLGKLAAVKRGGCVEARGLRRIGEASAR